MHVHTTIKSLGQVYHMSVRGYAMKQVRVRFAPSPTGYLHLGGLRTALYNYLFAKLNKGKFILRIEDTDQSRLIEGATEQLQKDLTWAGIEIDEGPNIGGDFGPYIQSQRLQIYRTEVENLINNESAYYCFCTSKRLDLLRKEALRTRQIPKYDNKCTSLTKEEVQKRLDHGDPHCIRFKILPGVEAFEDLIYGKVSVDISLTEGDPIIMKSDGYPTYHFANVVDDHFMQVSHVLRGVEWQISTPKHLLMYKAFKWKPPLYGHLPLLLNTDGSKLSKRQGDIQISHYRENGILTQAVVNFITSSGGGFVKDQERGLKPKIYTMDELTSHFDVKKINPSSGKLMPARLLEFNRLEIERLLQTNNDQALLSTVKSLVQTKFCDRLDQNTLQVEENHIRSILKWSVNRINRLSDLVSNDLMFLWVIPINVAQCSNDQLNAVVKLESVLSEASQEITKEKVYALLRDLAQRNNVPFKDLMKLLRNILSGLKEGPSVGEMMEILGKENTLLRIKTYLEKNNVR